MRNRNLFILFALFLSPSLYAQEFHARVPRGPITSAQLVRDFETLFEDRIFRNSPVGVWVESVDRNRVFYQRNAATLFAPASNMKIVTTAAAVSVLGMDYRYITPLGSAGEIREGVLHGDLWLIGTGDPSISRRFARDGADSVFRRWAAELREMGIERIAGDVIGDDDLFTDALTAPGWALERYRTRPYAAQSSALSFNDNTINLDFRPNPRIGAPCLVTMDPDTGYMTLENRSETVRELDRECIIGFERREGTNHLFIQGRMRHNSRNHPDAATVHNPTAYAVTVLKETLEREGISVDGEALDVDDLPEGRKRPANLVTLATHESPPLAHFIPIVNKRSDNFIANQLYMTVGASMDGIGGFVESGTSVMRWMNSLGIDTEGMVMMDGSGLSEINLVTPIHLASLLVHMARLPEATDFIESMAVMGEDGTLRNRLQGTPAAGSVFAKTGTIRGTRALSGYVRSEAGELHVFAFLCNNAEPVSWHFSERCHQAILNLYKLKKE